MGGGPNRRNKAAFSDFSGVVWTGPQFVSVVNLRRVPIEFVCTVNKWLFQSNLAKFPYQKKTNHGKITKVKKINNLLTGIKM